MNFDFVRIEHESLMSWRLIFSRSSSNLYVENNPLKRIDKRTTSVQASNILKIGCFSKNLIINFITSSYFSESMKISCSLLDVMECPLFLMVKVEVADF